MHTSRNRVKPSLTFQCWLSPRRGVRLLARQFVNMSLPA
jgi:hypothetical protein